MPCESQGTVRVIILLPDADEPSERAWLAAAASNQAFDDLADPRENLYSLDDGEPFVDARHRQSVD